LPYCGERKSLCLRERHESRGRALHV